MTLSLTTALWLSLALAADPAPLAPDATEAPVTEAATGPDRSAPPMVAPAVPIVHPDAEIVQLSPGVRLHWLQVPGIRRVELNVTMWGGATALDADNRWQLAFTDELRDVATKGYDAQALSERQETLDAWVTSYGGRSYQAFSIDAVPSTFGDGLDLLDAILHEPAFPNADLKRSQRDNLLSLTTRSPNEATSVAWRLADQALYPSDHPMGRPRDLVGLAAVKVRDLAALAPIIGTLGPTDIVVVGDVALDDWRDRLTSSLGPLGIVGERPQPAPAPPVLARTFASDMKGNEQAYITVSFPAPSRHHDDALAFGAVDHALTGAFLSRMNSVLREEHGLTYGVNGYWTKTDTHGWWQVGLDVARGDVGQALELLLHEVERIAEEGATPDEISAAAAESVSSWNGLFEDANTLMSFYDGLVDRETDVATRHKRLLAAAKLTPEATQQAAARWLRLDQRVIAIAGDREALTQQLSPILDDVTWVTPEDAILGTFPRGFTAKTTP